MMLPDALQVALRSWLETTHSEPVPIDSIAQVSGGSINHATKITTAKGTYFVKYNTADKHPGMFEAEAKGLALLAGSNEVPVLKALTTGIAGDHSYLVTHFQNGKRQPHFWEDFGRGLARLHRHTNDTFGLDHNNYIGSLPQSNTPASTWAEFFVTQRLEPQCKQAADKGYLDSAFLRAFDRLYNRLETIFPQEPPALIHGDLWMGNFLETNEGQAALIDPAVYYGHREMDLGMSELFHGFDPTFYRSYQDEYPLEQGWEKRVDVANLYPLLVHVNLFGETYLYPINQTLNYYS